MWYYYVSIDDPDLISGTSIHRLIRRVTTLVPCSEVLMDRLDFVAITPPTIQAMKGKWPILSPDALQEFVLSLTQVVWGDFYFFAQEGDASKVDVGGSFQELVESTAFTICACDNMSYELYFRSTAVACDLLADDLRMRLVKDESPRFWTPRNFG